MAFKPFAACVTAVVLALACKPKPGQIASEAADFAFKADAGSNFFLFAGYRPADMEGALTDSDRWFNMASAGELGHYQIALNNPAASYADIEKAFQTIAPRLTAESTIVFAYSGQRVGNMLLAANGNTPKTFSLAEAMAPVLATRTKFARLLILNDSNASGVTNLGWLTDDPSAAGLRSMVTQIIEFRASSAAVNPQDGTYKRLSMGFTTNLANFAARFRAGGEAANPTLGQFFDAVRAQDTTGQTMYRTLPASLATEVKMFNARTFPAPSQGVLNAFDAVPLVSEQGLQTSFGQLRPRSRFLLLEISSSWCGPCAQAALRIAADPQAQAMFHSDCAQMITTIVSDPENPALQQTGPVQLSRWRFGLDQMSRASNGQLGPELVNAAMEHSYWTIRAGRELNGVDRTGTPYPPGYLPASLRIDTYPKFMMVNAQTGQVAVAGMAGDYQTPLNALKQQCPAL